MTSNDDAFHEIQLNGKQLVFLFMAGTIVAVVIFLLGVFVGRGVGETNQVTAQELPAPAPDAPAVAAGSTGSAAPATANENLSYPYRLGQEPVKEALRETPPPAEERPVPSPRETPPAQAASNVPTEPSGNGFAIQLAALGKREEAETIVQRLHSKGYSAYLMAPAAGAPAVFRVRVGKFKERREAESVSARLQKEEQFKPWIVR